MGNLDYERVLRQTPPVCWQVMILVIVEWLALQYGYLDYSYTFFGSPSYKHKFGALLFGGFFFRHLMMNVIGVHMVTWYFTRSLKQSYVYLFWALISL